MRLNFNCLQACNFQSAVPVSWKSNGTFPSRTSKLPAFSLTVIDMQHTQSSLEQAASLSDEGSKLSPPSIRMKEGRGEGSSASPIKPASSRPAQTRDRKESHQKSPRVERHRQKNGDADGIGSSTGSCQATCASGNLSLSCFRSSSIVPVTREWKHAQEKCSKEQFLDASEILRAHLRSGLNQLKKELSHVKRRSTCYSRTSTTPRLEQNELFSRFSLWRQQTTPTQ